MKKITWAVIACCISHGLHAELYFDTSALQLSEEDRKQLDLSDLIQPNKQIPGIYDVNLIVNHQRAGQHKISFVSCPSGLCAELSVKLLADLGVKTDAFPALAALATDSTIINLGQYIPEASAQLDFSQLTLVLSIPQAALKASVRDDIPPEQWDDGISMLFMNYNLSGMESKDQYRRDNSQYLNLRSGVNIGPWRARHYGYYNHDSEGNAGWTSLQSYVERDIRRLRAHLTLGETSTNGLVFDSFAFKGAQLASDTEMLPESQQGFAPIIRGIALSNAQVEVRQKGNLIYQTFVPPGEFEITDLYPTSSSGDLDISIREADGTVRTFVQAFSAAPAMVRQGQVQFALNSGDYSNDDPKSKQARFAQGEIVYGLLNGTTVYGGLIGAENYRAVALGIGQSLGEIGALSADVTQARAKFQDQSEQQGQSYQFRYSKNITATDTTMTLAGYRYTTKGYYSFDDANTYWQNPGSVAYGSPKDRMQLIMNQSFGSYGAFSISAYQQNYWQQNRGKTRSVTGSYNVNVSGVGLSLGYSTNRSRGENGEKVVSLNVSVPLSRWLPSRNNYSMVSYNMSHSDQGRTQNMASLSGTLLQDSNLNYSVSQSETRDKNGSGTSSGGAATLQYTGSKGVANVGYTHDYGNSQRLNYGLQGAVVVHPYGVTLSQSLNDSGSSALVRAPGAAQTRVMNNVGIQTDSRGYAIVPYLSSYRSSNIALDTSTLNDDVDITRPIRQVVPTKGALVLADYQPKVGNRVFMTLNYRGGKVPFGAIVSAGENSTGIVNERGEIFLSGVSPRATLQVSWGSHTCQAQFDENTVKKINGIAIVNQTCR